MLPARASSRPGLSPLYVAARTSVVTLRDGSRVILRPVVVGRPCCCPGFERLSPESRYRRFFGPMKELSEPLLDYLTAIDYRDHFAWAALSAEPGPYGRPAGLGVGRYIRLEDPQAAEMAVTVVDDWQGGGSAGSCSTPSSSRRWRTGSPVSKATSSWRTGRCRSCSGAPAPRFRPGGPGVLRFSIDLPPGTRRSAALPSAICSGPWPRAGVALPGRALPLAGGGGAFRSAGVGGPRPSPPAWPQATPPEGRCAGPRTSTRRRR